jgi:hypothetical protein
MSDKSTLEILDEKGCLDDLMANPSLLFWVEDAMEAYAAQALAELQKENERLNGLITQFIHDETQNERK